MNPKTALQVFTFDSHAVRVVMKDDAPWFVAKDVAEALDYKVQGGMNKYIAHVPEEWRGVHPISTPSGTQDMAVLSEAGMFFFVNRSDKPKALPFQKLVAGEILPSIHKTGSYTAPGSQPDRTAGENEIISLQRELLKLYREREVMMQPQPKPVRNAPTELTEDEITQITLRLAQGASQAQIARDIGRSAGTVSKYVLMIRGRN